MLDQFIQLVVILFLLSMVCERLADFLKHYLCGSKVLGIGDTITKFPGNDRLEQARAYRVLKINVWCGIITAAIVKADLIWMFNNFKDAGKTLGWKNFDNSYTNTDLWFMIPGIVLTGCFISFGSKFWHDLLDLLYQIKNTKRVLSDPETYKIDNVATLQKVVNTYQSEFIKAAYLEAKTRYMAMDHVKAISIQYNDLGYYFEVKLNRNDTGFDQAFLYDLSDGGRQTIPIKTIVLPPGEGIKAHSVDLSTKVFDIKQPGSWGTAGILVKPLDPGSTKIYLLTCCHNVIKPISNLPYDCNGPSVINAGILDRNTQTPIGKVFKAERDFEMDAALIEIEESKRDSIRNYIPQIGTPGPARSLKDSDVDRTKLFLYGANTGATSGRSEGVVRSIYNDAKIEYSTGAEFTIINCITASNNGKAISKKGDSGACVVDANYNVIGLVVAGDSYSTYILPIQTLLSKFKVQLV